MADSPSLASASGARAHVPKVVYVMGAGRSGSTILGVTLGNCADFFYAGELDKWLSCRGVSPLGGAERARFWEDVRRDVTGAESLFGYAARCLERSSALFRIRRWPARRRLRGAYVRVAEELYRAVARAAEASHVIDTSHYPLRARELQRVSGVDLFLVFLVRDPHSVVTSLGSAEAREPTFAPLKANAYLWLTHLVSLLVFLRHRRDRRLFLRYEQFTADPEGVLRAMLGWLDSSASLPDFSALRTGLPIQGNRLLQEEVVSLEMRASRPQRSTLTSLLQLPWAAISALLRPGVAVAPPPRSARVD